MKTQIDGIEITPKMANALKDWYEVIEDSRPEFFVSTISKAQDYITRFLVGSKPLSEEELKDCLSALIFTKDELKRIIPEEEASHDTP